MDKMKMESKNLADENFQKLAALFPNAVTENKDKEGKTVRAIDKDVLMQEINTAVVDGRQERYQFTWPDKKEAILLANQPTTKTLRLDRKKSVSRNCTPGGDIDSENIYIEGDNLDALKILRETYLGKVKMIYIEISLSVLIKKKFRTPNSKSSLIYGLLKDFLLKAVFYFPLKRIFVVSRISFQQS